MLKKKKTHISRPKDTEFKDAYKHYSIGSNVRRFRIGCLLAVSLVPAGSLFDYFIYPEHFYTFLTVRSIFTALYIGFYLLSYLKMGQKHIISLSIILMEMVAIPIVMMIRYSGGYESPYYAGLNLVILCLGVLFNFTTLQAVLACLMLYVTYLIPIFMFDEITKPDVFFNNNYFISFTIIIAVISAHVGYRLRFNEFISKSKLSDAVEELSQLDKAKTNFFSGISHEFRTPLTLILAPIEHMLQQGNLPPETQERLKVCHGNALRLLKLINNLLDVIRINTGRMELRYSKQDISQLLKQVIQNVSPLAETKKIQIHYSRQGYFFSFFWDEDQIEKVVVNLIYNALKFTHENGQINISCIDKNNKIRVEIKDSGIGIPEDQVDKIFDPFYQVDSGSKRSYEGSGMGLALCRQIVELHGGKIWAKSQPGKGTEMFFEIPKKESVEQSQLKSTAEEKDWTKQVSRDAVYEKSKLSQKRVHREEPPKPLTHEIYGSVLVVEDNQEMQEFIVSELSKMFTVFRANNGKEGLEVALEKTPDLIVSDVMMPEMDGYELCRRIKKDKSTMHTPVLLLTAKTEIDMRLSGYEEGADDYVAKPFNMQELLAKAKALIHGRRLEREMELYRRLASVGELAAGVAHEINNALNVAVLANARLKKLLKKQTEDGEQTLNEFIVESEKGVSLLDEGLARAHGVVKSLLTFSKKNAEGYQFQNVQEGLDSTLNMLENELSHNIKIHKKYNADKDVYCDLNQLNQVFLNIIKNAIEALSGKGNIFIQTHIEKNQYVISIKDDGPGIPKEMMSRIFDPFFTTKPVGKGTGLGLSVSYNIVLEHQGTLVCKSKPGQGTEFVVSLPLGKPQEAELQEEIG